jgi:hypothetical protein
MSKVGYFLLVETLLTVIIAAIIFKSFKTFFECFYSFLFSDYYVFWKKLWDKHFNRSIRFVGFILIVGIFTFINILIYDQISN